MKTYAKIEKVPLTGNVNGKKREPYWRRLVRLEPAFVCLLHNVSVDTVRVHASVFDICTDNPASQTALVLRPKPHQ